MNKRPDFLTWFALNLVTVGIWGWWRGFKTREDTLIELQRIRDALLAK